MATLSHSDNNTALSSKLANLHPGNLPYDVFAEVARLTVTPVVELVIIKEDFDTLKVFLMKRSESDDFWPGMYHVPGAIISPTHANRNLSGIAHQICEDKLKFTPEHELVFVDNMICSVKRGVELAIVFAVKAEGEIAGGQFYDVNALPNSLIEGHKIFISQAVKLFSGR